MATQISSHLLSGGLGNLVFYMLNGKPVVRKNGSASGTKIKRDRRFERFRENGIEFGQSVKAAGLLFYGLGILRNHADNQMRQRLNKVFTGITRCDTINKRGDRKAIVGLQTEQGRQQLAGFEVNDRLKLQNVLKTGSGIMSSGDEVVISDFHYNNVMAPAGATHVMLRACWLGIDPAAEYHWRAFSEAQLYNNDMEVCAVILEPKERLKETPLRVTLLMISFWTGGENELSEMTDVMTAAAVVGVHTS